LTIKKLIFLGAGQANLHALAAFKAMPRADTDVHLITPHDTVLSWGMLPGLVAGHYSAGECSIDLPSLLGKSAIKPHYTACTGVDPTAQLVHLSNGDALHYDVLSIDANPVIDRDALNAHIPGAKEHALFAQPPELFAKLWPQVLAHAEQHALNISVVGAGHTGMELAMALQHRLPHCRVTLIAGPTPPPASAKAGLRQRVLAALKARNITVLQDNCSAIEAHCMHLSSGASLLCDMALLTEGGQPPLWVSQSGFALDADGHIAVNSFAQCPSYPQVFAAGAPDGVASKGSGQALQHNLRAAIDHQPLKAQPRRKRSVNLLSCGSRTAIASWGAFTLKGYWAWWWKNVMDQRWIRQYKL
jgi:NADH dehydrogenase FAD-containing subunit